VIDYLYISTMLATNSLFSLILNLVTLLGNSAFYVIIISLIYWFSDRKFGKFLFITLGFSALFVSITKIIFLDSRPYWFDNNILLSTSSSSFGLPSGHALISLVILSLLFLNARKLYFKLICLLLIPAIGLSRIYLGVHYPYQIIFGWLFGIIILYLIFSSHLPISKWWNNMNFKYQLSLLLSFSFFIIIFCIMLVNYYEILLTSNSAETVYNVKALNILSVNTIFFPLGFLSGIIISEILYKYSKISDFSYTKIHVLIKFIVGFSILYLLYYINSYFEIEISFIIGILIGLWILLFCPILFKSSIR